MTLQDLLPSMKTMTDEQLLELIRKSRQNRESVKPATTKRKVERQKQDSKKVRASINVNKLSKEQVAGLLALLEKEQSHDASADPGTDESEIGWEEDDTETDEAE